MTAKTSKKSKKKGKGEEAKLVAEELESAREPNDWRNYVD